MPRTPIQSMLYFALGSPIIEMPVGEPTSRVATSRFPSDS